ncbi:MAG: hypothetical protein ACNA7Q_14335 [Rhodobacterales bacterium]
MVASRCSGHRDQMAEGQTLLTLDRSLALPPSAIIPAPHPA